jgi:hypothetical protein
MQHHALLADLTFKQTGSKVTRYTFLITHVHGAREWPCSLSRAVKRRTSHRHDCREVAFSAHRAGIAFGSLY